MNAICRVFADPHEPRIPRPRAPRDCAAKASHPSAEFVGYITQDLTESVYLVIDANRHTKGIKRIACRYDIPPEASSRHGVLPETRLFVQMGMEQLSVEGDAGREIDLCRDKCAWTLDIRQIKSTGAGGAEIELASGRDK